MGGCSHTRNTGVCKSIQDMQSPDETTSRKIKWPLLCTFSWLGAKFGTKEMRPKPWLSINLVYLMLRKFSSQKLQLAPWEANLLDDWPILHKGRAIMTGFFWIDSFCCLGVDAKAKPGYIIIFLYLEGIKIIRLSNATIQQVCKIHIFILLTLLVTLSGTQCVSGTAADKKVFFLWSVAPGINLWLVVLHCWRC